MGRERGSPDRREQVEIESLGSEMIQPPVIMHQNWLTCGPFRGKRPSSGTGNGFASEVWSKNRAKKTTCRDRASHHRQNDGGLHRKYPVRMYEPPASHHRQNDGGLHRNLLMVAASSSGIASHHRQNDGGLHPLLTCRSEGSLCLTSPPKRRRTTPHLATPFTQIVRLTSPPKRRRTTPYAQRGHGRKNDGPHITAKTTADYANA